jgi:hypothetical protein
MGNIIAIGDGGGGPSTAVETVSTFAALPSPPSEGIGAERVTDDTGVLYIWDGAAWNAAAGGGSIVGATNVGTGTGLSFKDVVGANLRFRSIGSSDASIAIGSGADTIDITNPGILSFNTRTGAVTLTASDVNSALGLGASNAFVFTDAGINLTTYGSWSIDPVTQFSNVSTNYAPNNLSAAPSAYGWGINVAPLQNSPDDSIQLHNLQLNLDSSATGFNFGGNGQAAMLISGGYNYGGNGATFGTIRNINFYAGLGNGTDPGTFQGFVASSHALNAAANITVKNSFTGYDFNLNINAAAIADPSFNILWLTDFSQIPVDVYGYQGVVCQPNIATIKNNRNFNGVSIGANITTMEGNAGFYAFNAGGTITTLGTSGLSGFNLNYNVGTIPATANYNGVSCYSQITTMDAGSSFIGSSFGPNITTFHGSFTGYQSFPQIAGGDGQVQLFNGGMGSVHTTGFTSVLNLNGQTADGKDSAFSADSVSMNIGGNLIPLSGQGVQVKHVLFTSYNQNGVGSITGTDVLVNVLSPNVDFGSVTDSLALGPSGLGFSMVGFAGQTTGHGSMDLLSAVIPTAIFASDFTLGEFRNINAYVINAGYSGATTKATAFYHEVAGAGLFATTHWGLRVVTPLVENYVESMAFGTGTQKVTNASVAIEMGGTTRTLVNLNVTTAQKTALTALPGMQVYDTDLNQFSYYNGTTWVNL